MTIRTPRTTETRDNELRPNTWKPPELIPNVPKQKGWGFRWVRAMIGGESDAPNMDYSFRMGWRPATHEDVPELAHLQGKDGRGEDIIVYGGLILCKMPTDTIAQRDAHYRQVAESQMTSVNQQLKDQAREDKRMPMFNHSETR